MGFMSGMVHRAMLDGREESEDLVVVIVRTMTCGRGIGVL